MSAGSASKSGAIQISPAMAPGVLGQAGPWQATSRATGLPALACEVLRTFMTESLHEPDLVWSAKLAWDRSLEDAVCEAEQPCLDTSVEAARVGACATSAQRVFIAFGGPQGHRDSLEDAVKIRTKNVGTNADTAG
jgi:hypothetical protein